MYQSYLFVSNMDMSAYVLIVSNILLEKWGITSFYNHDKELDI